MSKYLCPGCNTVMDYNAETVIYKCDKCFIIYLDELDNHSNNGNFFVEGDLFTNGTFEYCCRVYKLKAFG